MANTAKLFSEKRLCSKHSLQSSLTKTHLNGPPESAQVSKPPTSQQQTRNLAKSSGDVPPAQQWLPAAEGDSQGALGTHTTPDFFTARTGCFHSAVPCNIPHRAQDCEDDLLSPPHSPNLSGTRPFPPAAQHLIQPQSGKAPGLKFSEL